MLGSQGLLRELDHDRIPQPLASSARTSSTSTTTATTAGLPRLATASTASATAATSSPSSPPTGPSFFALVPRYSLQGITFFPGPIQPVAAALAALDQESEHGRRRDAPARAGAAAGRPAARERVHRRRGRRVRPRRASCWRWARARTSTASWSCRSGGSTPSSCCRTGAPRCGSTAGSSRWRARHPLTAQAFIDHQLSAPAAARAWAESRLPAPEQAARRLLPAALRADRLAALDPAVVNRYTPAAVTPAGLQKRAEIWGSLLAA